MQQIKIVSVSVKEYDAAIEFYTQKRGFEVAEDLDFGDRRWITLSLHGDRCALALELAKSPERTRPSFGISYPSASLSKSIHWAVRDVSRRRTRPLNSSTSVKKASPRKPIVAIARSAASWCPAPQASRTTIGK